MHPVFKLFVVSALIMGLAQTIAKERIFAPLRAKLGGKETWLGYLVSCPYCASHWIAFAVVPLTGAYYVDIVPSWGPVSGFLRWFFSSVFVAITASLLRVVFNLVDESQELARAEKATLAQGEIVTTRPPLRPPRTEAPHGALSDRGALAMRPHRHR